MHIYAVVYPNLGNGVDLQKVFEYKYDKEPCELNKDVRQKFSLVQSLLCQNSSPTVSFG